MINKHIKTDSINRIILSHILITLNIDVIILNNIVCFLNTFGND